LGNLSFLVPVSTPGIGDSGDSAGFNSSCTRGFGNVFSFALGLHPMPVRDAAPTDAASACVIEAKVARPLDCTEKILVVPDLSGSGSLILVLDTVF